SVFAGLHSQFYREGSYFLPFVKRLCYNHIRLLDKKEKIPLANTLWSVTTCRLEQVVIVP
ncbi:MAG: hypothetical protein JXA33_10505, partial [Anaerolineae bacterium]|nr:hypothetical protein [Anaerolineae bacterium]